MFWSALALLFSFTLDRHSSSVSLEKSPPPSTISFNEIVSLLSLSISFMLTIFVSRCSVYSGHHTILIPPGDLETNPALWLSVVSQYKGNNFVCHSRGFYCIPRVSFRSQSVSVFRYLGLTDAQPEHFRPTTPSWSHAIYVVVVGLAGSWYTVYVALLN